jgi:hypothetical protein
VCPPSQILAVITQIRTKIINQGKCNRKEEVSHPSWMRNCTCSSRPTTLCSKLLNSIKLLVDLVWGNQRESYWRRYSITKTKYRRCLIQADHLNISMLLSRKMIAVAVWINSQVDHHWTERVHTEYQYLLWELKTYLWLMDSTLKSKKITSGLSSKPILCRSCSSSSSSSSLLNLQHLPDRSIAPSSSHRVSKYHLWTSNRMWSMTLSLNSSQILT